MSGIGYGVRRYTTFSMNSHSSEQGARAPGVKVTKRPKKRTVSSKKEGPHSAKAPRGQQFVTADWTVADIVARYPQATSVMAEYGLHCFGCSASGMETLEEGCSGHGFTTDDIENLVEDINELIATTPPRPEVVTLTKDAALAIKDVAAAENVSGQGLSIQVHPDGNFFMEFRSEPEQGEKVFHNDEVHDVSIYVSILTLQRIGGATIDFRDGKFKLDLPESSACCKNGEGGGGCQCASHAATETKCAEGTR